MPFVNKFCSNLKYYNTAHDTPDGDFNYCSNTAWKVSKYGVISGPHFPVFRLNTGKYGPEITLYLDTFHAVLVKPANVCLFEFDN